MGFLNSFFSKNRASKAATATDVARGLRMHGHEVGQTAAEQAATRDRMEAELLTQRHQREQTARSDA